MRSLSHATMVDLYRLIQSIPRGQGITKDLSKICECHEVDIKAKLRYQSNSPLYKYDSEKKKEVARKMAQTILKAISCEEFNETFQGFGITFKVDYWKEHPEAALESMTTFILCASQDSISRMKNEPKIEDVFSIYEKTRNKELLIPTVDAPYDRFDNIKKYLVEIDDGKFGYVDKISSTSKYKIKGACRYWTAIYETFCSEEELNLSISESYEGVEPEETVENAIRTLNCNTLLGRRFELDRIIPLKKRLEGTNRIRFLNFAGTTFLNQYIAEQYNSFDEETFTSYMLRENVKVEIILTNPLSSACQEAALYKMYPSEPNVYLIDIIPLNLSKLLLFRDDSAAYPIDWDIRITDVHLPYGIFMGLYAANHSLDWMKVDIYSPYTGTDMDRPCFQMLRGIDSQTMIFELFERNYTEIKRNSYKVEDYMRDISSWLTGDKKKYIAHRGVCAAGLQEHTTSAYIECMRKQLPMEIDLLRLKDGTTLVYRDVFIEDTKQYLSDYNFHEFEYLRKTKSEYNEVLLFEEFLEIIRGRVPLLIEIKGFSYNEKDKERKKFVQDVLRSLLKINYQGEYAIHSANPYVIRDVKEYNYIVPAGIISWSFDTASGKDIEYIKEIHSSEQLISIQKPDFISYKISDLILSMNNNDTYKTYGNFITDISIEYGIPLIGWTAKSEQDCKLAKAFGLKNIIIEGEEHLFYT